MKKKVLCLIDGLSSGGAQRQIAGLTYLLKQSHYDVDLAYYHDPNFYSEWLNDKGICAIKLPLRENKLGKLSIVKNFIKQKGYSTVIAYMGGPTVICCLLKMMGLKIKLIVSERNVTQKLDIKERIKFWMYRWADVVTANSYTQTNLIIKNYNYLTSKTICITNYVDLDYFTPASNISDSDKRNVLVVGRISYQKNIPTFLKALKLVKEKNVPVRVSWYGNYDKACNEEILYNSIMELRVQYGLTDIIDFFPASKNILKEYGSCDVFCLPSLFEGFPNVICEAMSCGKPILCSRVCDNPMIVEDGVNGFLFDPTSPNDIADAIVKVSRLSTNELGLMGEKSRSIAESKFSSVSFVNKYIEII